MGSRYKIRDLEGVYFITSTVVAWADVFIRKVYRDCLLDAFRYCMKHKGLNIHAYVIMSSHFHAIVSAKEGYVLPATIRDLKRHTSSELIRLIKTFPESRREWLLKIFSDEAQRVKRGKHYILWQEGYHAKQLITNQFIDQKLEYIHENPVVAGWVAAPSHYLYSSASNYAEEESLLTGLELI